MSPAAIIEACAKAAEAYDRQPFPGLEAGVSLIKSDIAYRIRKLGKSGAIPLGPCEACDGEGRIWNNADPTSGQYVECEECVGEPS